MPTVSEPPEHQDNVRELQEVERIQLEDATQGLLDVYNVLASDLDEAVALLNTSPSLFADRTLVRAFFALVEGMSYRLRQVALAYHAIRATHLTDAEVQILREQSHAVDEWGVPHTKTAYAARTLPMLLLSMRCYAKVHLLKFEPAIRRQDRPNQPSAGWIAMRKFNEARNHVTHPKDVADLNLRPGMRTAGNDASVWFKGELVRLLNECNASAARINAGERGQALAGAIEPG